jgi:hypothetical protein
VTEIVQKRLKRSSQEAELVIGQLEHLHAAETNPRKGRKRVLSRTPVQRAQSRRA